MTRINLLLCACMAIASSSLHGQSGYNPMSTPIQSRWAKEVTPTNALPEYPRPQMIRPQWQNLNGLWQYAITAKDSAMPNTYQGQILVPFPIESSLSGVQKAVSPTQNLWYKTSIIIDHQVPGQRTLLQFGAVDWQATVFVNGQQIGEHTGGYQHFSFDISTALHPGNNDLVIKVYDPTDQGPNPHGKQVLNPKNIWYTASTGIWQTVWIETVPTAHIEDLRLTPDIDRSTLTAMIKAPSGYQISLVASSGGKQVAKAEGKTGSAVSLKIPSPHLWSFADPFLYDLEVRLIKNGKMVDQVTSYFGMRKVSIQKDEKGYPRIYLNNKYTFNLGVLDQGFWPEGLLTAPTDDALAFDIKAIKSMGFNTIRKHIKIEPDRWYYHADKLGMLVWQDMPNAAFNLTPETKTIFEKESRDNVDQLYSHPCIITWVLFNEQWGSYDQKRLTEWMKAYDPTRLVNAHSGEYIFIDGKETKTGKENWVSSDIADVHSYPDPMNAPGDGGKVRILGEFGGIGVSIPGHQWNELQGWGYVQATPAQLKTKYKIMYQHVKMLETEGLAGSIYTEPFDVEGEENGLMTYDREIIKIPFADLRAIHAELVPTSTALPTVSANTPDLSDPAESYSLDLERYKQGERNPAFLRALSITALRVGDKAGAARISNAYIASLHPPYSKELFDYVFQFTNGVRDSAGYALITSQVPAINALYGIRYGENKIFNLLYNEHVAPAFARRDNTPDWNLIERRLQPFGETGQEVYLRSKVIYLFNKKNWKEYKPLASTYLDKYGAHLSGDDRKTLTEALKNVTE
ncbi:glycoside hydrolase family 2 protein [[Flexibacter] sp. ATCC 35208]|uniref:glycoside hydrolase family 2 protein n=1 Tax=[Flexibacter] sp. ATCC 35208 TaxID=1936242 RepID=UPI0009C52EA8|nr:sugar-binding domain-containing protein [[Flexibacter] sp. ATCC 35208]OMP80060.1 glycosyl transferase family 2 [[Flexibacter] sp. ATCC 35208]